jgi:hypothetical protein
MGKHERKRIEVVTSCSSVHRCGLPSDLSLALVAFVHGRLNTFYTTFTRRQTLEAIITGRGVNNGGRGVGR